MLDHISEKDTKDERLRNTFRAIKDQRTFHRAPRLKPTEVQREMAKQAVIRIRDRLPYKVINKLNKRSQEEGHYINTVRYYPFPILAYGGSWDTIETLIDWGHTYAAIMRKITRFYRSPDQSTFRRFLNLALMKFFPPYLLRLIENYRTIDDLAGAHLGDDNLAGRSIEWNLGAVGGLDEGYLAAKAVAGSWNPGSESEKGIRPIESDPVSDIRDTLYWAYESYCLGNHIKHTDKPFIASVEHDDIYGSTVSICERLRNFGEDVYLCFDRELSYHNSRLITASGHPIDLVYMDCHLEDLLEGHPILKAISENAVAVDCSPFAHLVLRSKVIIALLCNQRVLNILNLDQHERNMLDQHLMSTLLWRRKTFIEGKLQFSGAAHALLADKRFKQEPYPVKTSSKAMAAENRDEIVVKIAIGSVYGGSAVSVVENRHEGYKTKDAANLIYDLVSVLAAEYTYLEASKILISVKNLLKAKIKELILLSLSRRLSDTDKDKRNRDDPFWNEVETLWETLICASPGNGPDVFLKSIKEPLHRYFNIDVYADKSAEKTLWRKLEKEILKTVCKTGDPLKNRKYLDQLTFTLGHILATIQYRRRGGGKIYGALLDHIKAAVNPKEKINYANLTHRVMNIIQIFFIKDLETPLPERECRQLISILLEPYIIRQLSSVNPVVMQPYVRPDILSGESGLHIMNRIHVLFTKKGTKAFMSGAQVFFLKDSKPNNNYKMTGSLWVTTDDE